MVCLLGALLDPSFVGDAMFIDVVDRPKERLMEEVNATGGDGARFITLSLFLVLVGVEMNAALPSESCPFMESKLLLRSNFLSLPEATDDCLV